jgi:hypothetical protein
MQEGEPKDYEKKANEMWAMFTDNERMGVSSGMFPYAMMAMAKRVGYEPRALAVALMKIEKAIRS